MAIKITSGKSEYEIVDSGTVISFQNEPLNFHIDTLKVVLIFESNESDKRQEMKHKIMSNEVLELTLVNFSSSLGSGNAVPLPIAKLNNRQLYLNFIIYALSETSSKTVHYTWYLREEVKNG